MTGIDTVNNSDVSNVLKDSTSKARQSNIELCRIICMLLIIAHHSVIHGGAIGMEACLNKYLAFFLVPGGKLCFVTFMVISTWFLVDGQFNLERFIKTWLQVFLYSVFFAAAAAMLGAYLTARNWFSVFFPISGNSHGFAATYLAFYLLLPFLGMITQKVKKKGLAFLVILLIYFQVVSKIMAVINGYNLPILSSELTLFILFYFISLWLKRYPLAITSNKVAMFGTFLLVWLAIFGIWCSSLTSFAKTPLYVGLVSLSSDESSFLYILGGYSLFFVFKNLSIPNNRTINYIAHAAFGVLLFHDHNFFRYVLWQNILNAQDWYYKSTFIMWIIACVIGIYLIGLLMETVRQYGEKRIFASLTVKKYISIAEKYMELSNKTSSNGDVKEMPVGEDSLYKIKNTMCSNFKKASSSGNDMNNVVSLPNKHIFVVLYVFTLLCFCGVLIYLHTSNNAILVTRFISVKKLALIGVLGLSLFFPAMYFIQAKIKPSWYKLLFYSIMLLFICLMLVAGYITRGESIRSILADDPHDTLMDFFNSIQYGLKPYAAKVIYPPLINVFYGLLGRFTIIDSGGTYVLRENQLGMLVFGTYIIATYSSFIYFIHKFKEGGRPEKLLFIFVVLISLPFLYLFDRANSIIMAVIALIIFSLYHNSLASKYKIIAFVALGVSAGIKIAPAIYGAILLREKRFKDAVIAFLISIMIFIVPFMLTDGNPIIMLQNIAYTTGLMQGVMADPTTGIYRLTGNGHYLNTLNTSAFLGRLFNFNGLNIAEYLNGCILLLGTSLVVFANKIAYWKAWAILTCIVILYPGFSAIYNLAYMVIPLVLFLNSKPKLTKLNFAYMIFFLLLFIPFINIKVPFFNIFFNDWHPLTLMTSVQSITLLLMTIVLLIDSLVIVYKYQIRRNQTRFNFALFLVVILIATGIYGWKCGFSQRAVEAFYPYNLRIINAQNGLSLSEGQYYWINKSFDILLKTENAKKDGLIIKLVKPEWTKENIGKWNELKVFIEDSLVFATDEITGEEKFIYIEPEKIEQIAQGTTMRIRIERNGEEQSDYLKLSYIGPANLNDKLELGTVFHNTSEGLSIYDDNSLWMATKAKTLLKANDIVKKGLLIKVQAPKALFDANRNKEIKLDVFANGKIIKSIDIEDANEKTIAIDSNKLPISDVDEDGMATLTIGLKVNAVFNSRTMNLDVNNNDRSLIVKYIGACDSLPLGNGVNISKNKHFYFNATELGDDNLNIIYKVIPNSFVNEDEIVLTALLDGKRIYQKKLQKFDYDSLNMISIDSHMFESKKGISDLEISITGLSNTTNNVIMIPYIGKNQLSSEITSKTSNTDKDYHLITSGMEYDKSINGWMMGSTSEMILPATTFSKGIRVNYQVPRELLTANLGVNDIKLTVMINGNIVKDIPISKPGNFETILLPEELHDFVKADDSYLNIRLHVNAVYNLQKLKIRHQNINRSIDIIYLGELLNY